MFSTSSSRVAPWLKTPGTSSRRPTYQPSSIQYSSVKTRRIETPSSRRRFEPLDQRDLVPLVVVAELVDQALGQHDAEAPLADAQFIAHVEVADRIFVRGRVGDLIGVEARALVLNDQGHGLRVDPVG